ncbi:MAG: alanine--tRNA ligase [Oscillospiraceae bacterium]|jgi:alanyl-tRNA synthetase|nr:alanine--tRNA ligase [Oscillospiraceae bacterium]
MRPFGLNEIRESYLSFFERHDHLRWPSSSLVPKDDPSLLLINSGMAPLKPYFSGLAEPPSKRLTTCQKCVRVIDIDKVGKTDRHCTFFEMLGHFSFGDYFKREAIRWTWEFFTDVMGLDPARLYCSVYLDDDEAWDIWVKEVGVSESRMVRLGKEDNFWDIGAGPCGPCSEIYYDRGAARGCGKPDCKPGCDCDRFVEVGNNVFTQFHNDGEGNYTPLRQKNIDFGMGLERLACVAQGVDSVFEVDTVARLLAAVSEVCRAPYRSGEKTDVSLRVITDHIRSAVMLVSDGVLPSNEGRGYVLRRLLRRAAGHGRLLGAREPFLHVLADTVAETAGAAYPELARNGERIRKAIRVEEERFGVAVDAGMKMLDGEIKRAAGGVFSGDTAFTLSDTFGFPLDLTREVLERHGLTLDEDAYNAALTLQREKAREARAALRGDASRDGGALARGLPPTVFAGYDSLTCEASVLRCENGVMVLDKTPFYAESGGQCSDTGVITGPRGEVFRVTLAQKTPGGVVLHFGEAESGEFARGDTVTAKADAARREAAARAHSATHLLHAALRQVLGEHVTQAGSLVEPDTLRFDFTHYAALTQQEVTAVNRAVNDAILAGLPVTVTEMPLRQAKAQGAAALFGEKYGENVRTVRMGEYSFELCGGTHLANTSLAGAFYFGGESSVASGVRRIEACCGKEACRALEDAHNRLAAVCAALKTSPGELAARIEGMLAQTREEQKKFASLKSALARAEAEKLLQSAAMAGGCLLLAARMEQADTQSLNEAGDYLKQKRPDIAAVLLAETGGKLTYLCVCGAEAVARGADAGKIAREIAQACGGSGGGKSDRAMGGAKDPAAAKRILESAEKILKRMCGKDE